MLTPVSQRQAEQVPQRKKSRAGAIPRGGCRRGKEEARRPTANTTRRTLLSRITKVIVALFARLMLSTGTAGAQGSQDSPRSRPRRRDQVRPRFRTDRGACISYVTAARRTAWGLSAKC
jgi:hypothetical protein